MKKGNHVKYLRLQRKRERKRLKRLHSKHIYKLIDRPFEKEVLFRQKHDEKIIEKFSSSLEDFLNENGNSSPKSATQRIIIPEIFSLEDDYNSTIERLSLIRKSIIEFKGDEIEIDFKDCKKVDFSSLFLLKVLLEEYLGELRKLQSKLLVYKVIPIIKITYSLEDEVNLKLLANQIVGGTKAQKNDFIPISFLNLITGSKAQKHYAENKKGQTVTVIRRYINESLNRHNFKLDENGEKYLDGLISEILNNAEDHSKFDKWYAYGSLFETNRLKEADIVGEINLAFLNFGYSIYEGFENTKIPNASVYNEMERMSNIINSNSIFPKFSKENLFTLYALQEGFSRLKYIEPSRGTGTMTFINSFLYLGDYKDEAQNFKPHLQIYSGNTLLKCDDKFRPFCDNDAYYLSLNKEKMLTLPPEKSHLKHLDYKFPGTLLIVKIYLNEKHLKKKIENNGN